ncbi:hypothetical protein B5M09_011809 [Aphanomyces astaci]|uniref:Uncharacterized protein n=1 Tax=Aphanomyces astaci TaxID=112090 RepID=A0A425CT24_APHAT|nr:hypothetical protein B5M09_011809 [Aphanomyces astaci]
MCKVVTDGNMAELRKLLLDCDVNAASEPDSKNQWTPLHSACENGFADIVQLLMSRPELDVTGISSAKVANATPVHLAVKRQHTVVVQALVLHALAALISDSVAVAASATQFLAAFLAPEFPLDITARADVIQAVWAAHEDAAERRTMRNRLLEQSPAQPHDVLSRVVW